MTYLGSGSVIVTSFSDIAVECLAMESVTGYDWEYVLEPILILPMISVKNAGLDGALAEIVLPSSITLIIDIVGLSIWSSWTHTSPT